MDSLGSLRRTHTCNELGRDNLQEEVILMGWVLRRRDHGGVIFIDLRDRWGITQVVFNPEFNPEAHAKAHQIRSEWVLAVRGTVFNRPADMENTKLTTGAIEVLVNELRSVPRLCAIVACASPGNFCACHWHGVFALWQRLLH